MATTITATIDSIDYLTATQAIAETNLMFSFVPTNTKDDPHVPHSRVSITLWRSGDRVSADVIVDNKMVGHKAVTVPTFDNISEDARMLSAEVGAYIITDCDWAEEI